MSSSPLRPGADQKEQLEWYKVQYAQLETDLSDFQASSKELEEQLEKDIEAAEKNERKFKEQVEKLNFEVDEWKTKHKQAKDEANRAQNALQKEVTAMREENRALQLKLRDIEVTNDDYERQARNTEFEKDDLEGKYNAAIERGVLFEETIKLGEQERESLRVETQRLRDELGDLKVENEITLEKLRISQQTIEELRSSRPSSLAVGHLRARSPGSEASGMTPWSPTASTPPPKSDTASDAPTPPSPPLSDVPAGAKLEQKTPVPTERKSFIPDAGPTPRQSLYGPRGIARHSRGPSLASSTSTAVSGSMKPPNRPKTRSSNAADKLPRSDSLYQIRGLIGRMQKIEERVHSARSKLPAPGTPRGSPRTGSALSDSIPSSVTVRRSMKRPSASTASSVLQEDEAEDLSPSAGARRDSHTKRLSYSIPRPASSMSRTSDAPERPPSAMDRPPPAAAVRPSSRVSGVRPPSRTGARTELGHYSRPTTASSAAASAGRPRSSMAGSYALGVSRGHRPSTSISGNRQAEAENEESMIATPPRRRTTLDRSGLPTPSALPAPSFLSKSIGPGAKPPGVKPRTSTISSRTSSEFSPSKDDGELMPPPRRKQMSDVGETY
ncbi:Putative NUDE domain-containing protein [Septoria linicola]|uniref:NUDE domain-containing protein n=1 Tax=Septoria linicola TaxID=215465 RepID=A0A9Q9ANR5_9PEZI|nr:putative NUDE domain-containing protein [Septoria linicola]USW52340.1 Putative NUDE domain-containing protein [Septoria linicola]